MFDVILVKFIYKKRNEDIDEFYNLLLILWFSVKNWNNFWKNWHLGVDNIKEGYYSICRLSTEDLARSLSSMIHNSFVSWSLPYRRRPFLCRNEFRKILQRGSWHSNGCLVFSLYIKEEGNFFLHNNSFVSCLLPHRGRLFLV